MQKDKGAELFNALVKVYVADNNFKLFATHSEPKAQIVERLNRTIKEIMFWYFPKKNTKRYIDTLQNIVSKYSASYHRSIKIAPKDVSNDSETQI